MVRYILTTALFLLITIQNIHAQNAGGVFSPVVNENRSAAQYRITYDFKNDRMVNRVHFEDSINDDVMLRLVAQSRKTNDSNFDTDFLQGEAFWQLTDNNSRFQTGLRFDGRIRSDDRPHLIGIHWTNEYALTNEFIIRGLVMNSFEFGENANKGIGLQTRGALIYNPDKPYTLSTELYSSYGFSDNFNTYDDQQHQIGPHIDYRFGQYDIRLGQLFGLSSGSADKETRFWLTRRF